MFIAFDTLDRTTGVHKNWYKLFGQRMFTKLNPIVLHSLNSIQHLRGSLSLSSSIFVIYFRRFNESSQYSPINVTIWLLKFSLMSNIVQLWTDRRIQLSIRWDLHVHRIYASDDQLILLILQSAGPSSIPFRCFTGVCWIQSHLHDRKWITTNTT